jgi:alkane 1-monooxygenase
VGVHSTSIKNMGYSLVLLPQALLILSVHIGLPWLVLLFFFAGLPLLRYLIGNDLSPPNPKQLHPFVRVYLRSLPRLYCLTFAILLPWAAWTFEAVPRIHGSIIGFALSLWTVFALATCVAHELIHTVNSPLDRRLGRLLAAAVGYFQLHEEHFSHHERTGHYHSADVARPGQSIYTYSWKRYVDTIRSALDFECARLRREGLNKLHNRVFWTALVPILIACLFYALGGPVALGVYVFEVVATAFAVQAITYLQHWGLSEKMTPDLGDHGFSWEEGCWIQACITLNNSFHGQHHLYVRRPYYQLTMSKEALALPASYPVMFLMALFPPVLTRVMKAHLALWMNDESARKSMMHRADCFGIGTLARGVVERH